MNRILLGLVALSFVVSGSYSSPIFAEENTEVKPTGDSHKVAQYKGKKKKRKKRKKRKARNKSFSRPYGMAGCGFGSAVMGPDGSQVLAATTNGTSASQYFGITSGTVNCVDSPLDEMAQRLDNFVSGNKVALAVDMSRGQGETLYNLSGIMGCSNVGHFSQVMQSNFSKVYPNEKVSFMQVTDHVITVILSDEQLSKSCVSMI